MKQLFKNLKRLHPETTGLKPEISFEKDINTVLFDIYGTLLISASGDISSSNLKWKAALSAFAECGISIKADTEKEKEIVGESILKEYFYAIKQSHKNSKKNGIEFPEVNIIDIWQQTVSTLQSSFEINIEKPIDFEKMAITFEFLNNPTFPMPGMKEVLEKLSKEGITLGIISNAQFFTPMIMSFFLSDHNNISQKIPLFNNSLCVYSYEYGRAKPGIFLYEKSAAKLREHVILPENILYIGNDMLNDIYPAQQLGFKTALFAGDQRSLRLRKDNPAIEKIKPNHIITELNQILTIVINK
ncbi:MAG: HAD family hydrolase [Verrucomicrobiota bacterium]|nr:HAD family hydrolase [Verrucomicrobiota bacterium]